MGEEINLYGEETGEGTYILRYTVIDVFGGEHTKEIGITAKGKEFYAEIKIDKDYYAGDRIDLPDPEMSGALYESHASEVRVNKYYRVEGGTKWLSADDGFAVHSNAYVDLKYSVYADGVANVIAEKTIYVHANGVTFDYEEMADGSHLGVADDYDPNNPTPLSSNWSHDGKYSILMKSHKYYDIFAGMVFGGKGIQLDKTCNAMIFYAYSDKDVSGETSLGVLTENGWSEAYVRILKGEHKYVVKLPKEFSSFTKFGGQIKRGEDFYIDSVTFDKLVDFDVPEQSEIVVGGKEFTVNKPVGITYDALDTDETLGAEVFADKKTDVESAVINKMTVAELRKAFLLLSPDERELIKALFIDGATERKAAEIYGISQVAIHKRKNRILAKLKDFLEK